MPNYQLAKIYKIVDDIDDIVYVGSTSQRLLCERMRDHRHKARSGSTAPIHQHMRSVGVDRFRIVLVEDFPCGRREQLTAREDFWMSKIPKERLLNMHNAKMFDRRQLVTCPCGRIVCKYSLSVHRRSPKHREWATKHNIVVPDKRPRSVNSTDCPCGGCFTASNKTQHQLTARHRAFELKRAKLLVAVLVGLLGWVSLLFFTLSVFASAAGNSSS